MSDKENKRTKVGRDDRLNAALRANLQRRKAATRRPVEPVNEGAGEGGGPQN